MYVPMKFPFCARLAGYAILALSPLVHAEDKRVHAEDKRVHAEDKRVHADERGTWRHSVESRFQSGSTIVEVLLPEKFEHTKKYRVVYVLPVEPNEEFKFGDAIQVVRKFGYHNKHDVIFVLPTFSGSPWYGNHASDPKNRQEDYLIKDVLPLVERVYPTMETAEGRLLLGFSKSGWGALSLILRNPSIFGYAASWDAPLMMTEKQFGIWRTDEAFGTPENMARYLPSALLHERSAPFKEKTRIVVSGMNLFGTFADKKHPYEGPSHTDAFHSAADSAGVLHVYEPSLNTSHAWGDGWMRPVTELLLRLPENKGKP